MGLVSGLAMLGGVLGAAALLGRGGEPRQRAPLTEDQRLGSRPRRGQPQTGTAISREEFARRQAEGKVEKTNPPDPTKTESNAVADARAIALRARRRAAAGNAGKVKLPRSSNATPGGAPRTLLGY